MIFDEQSMKVTKDLGRVSEFEIKKVFEFDSDIFLVDENGLIKPLDLRGFDHQCLDNHPIFDNRTIDMVKIDDKIVAFDCDGNMHSYEINMT